MTVIYPYFLRSILTVHENIRNQMPYPFFDPACTFYEALRSVAVDGKSTQEAMDKFGLSEYGYNKAQEAFNGLGTIGLIGLDARQFVEDLPMPSSAKPAKAKKGKQKSAPKDGLSTEKSKTRKTPRRQPIIVDDEDYEE